MGKERIGESNGNVYASQSSRPCRGSAFTQARLFCCGDFGRVAIASGARLGMFRDMDFLLNQTWFRDDSPEKEEKEKKEKEPKSKLEEKFLETRTILLFGEISQKAAREVCEKLILLSSINDNISR